MQILNETAMPNPNPNLSPNHDTHTDECLDNHYHANNDWGDDHNCDMLDTDSQALWEYHTDSHDEYWHDNCENQHNQDGCHVHTNTTTQQDTTETPTNKTPMLIRDAQGNILGIRYVYADWLNDEQRALARRYVQHTLAPTKPVIEHIHDLCHENKISFDELASLASGIRAYQRGVNCEYCGIAHMVYPKMAKFKMIGLMDIIIDKVPCYVCTSCDVFKEVPF